MAQTGIPYLKIIIYRWFEGYFMYVITELR
jgi:hypothetical protein